MLTQGPSSELLGFGHSEPDLDATSRFAITPQPATQYPHVDLTCIPIIESVLNALPTEVLKRFRIVPFSLDREGARMRVACALPSDPALAVALASHLPSVSCECYQADPFAVDQILDRFFPSVPVAMIAPTSTVASIPEPVQPQPIQEENKPAPPQRIVLFATPERKISQHLQSAYTSRHFEPRVVRTLDALVRLVEQAPVEALFIHENFRSRCEPLVSGLEKQGSRITVRYYRTEVDLLLNETGNELSLNLHRKNLRLLRHLLDSNNGLRSAHAATVAHLAELVGTALLCPPAMREILLYAAFLHNLAEEDITSTDGYSQSDLITLSASRLTSWEYPTAVTELLREMSELLASSTSTDPQPKSIASEILATVDRFCHEWPDHAMLHYEQVQDVESRLQQLFSSTISPRVLSTFIGIVRDHFATSTRRPQEFHVHFCIVEGTPITAYESALLKAGFRVETSSSIEDCVKAAAHVTPQALVIRHASADVEPNDLLLSLALRGIRIDTIPTLLMLNENKVNSAMSLLRHGLDDILPDSISPDVLLTKLSRIKERTEDRSRLRLAILQDLGTHGSLEDMNLVDLLEAMRSNRRPVQISLTGNGNHLTVIIDQGKVVLAECEGHRGIDAVIQGLGWKRGIWSIDPIIPEQIPKTSLNEPVDSILLEACVQLDNSAARGQKTL
jgi:DNA-binding response OmpR family regulator